MSKARSSSQEQFRAWVEEALVAILCELFPTFPKALIRNGVQAVLAPLPEIDAEAVALVLRRLGLPGDLVDVIWDHLRAVLQDLVAHEAAAGPVTFACPESGDTIDVEEGDGTYVCPDCRQPVEVEAGVAHHPLLVSCPSKRRQFWVGAADGDYACPECGAVLGVADGEAAHPSAPRTRRAR